MKYMLDTDTCIYLINKRSSALLEKITSKPADQFALSTITTSELLFGVAKSSQKNSNLKALNHFFQSFSILAYDQQAARVYADIRTDLETKGRPIGAMDMLIAAHAKSRNLILISNNQREFGRIKGLKTENWA